VKANILLNLLKWELYARIVLITYMGMKTVNTTSKMADAQNAIGMEERQII
jgi:ABC-type proline/glycine betaine transport system permease subunit